MNRVKSAVVFVAAMLGAVASAVGGVGNAFTFATPTMTAVSDRVTYATTTPALVTYVGYDVGNVANNVLVTNSSGATANHFILKFTAAVVKQNGLPSQETLTGFSITSAIDLSSICSFDTSAAANPLTVTCNVQQLKNGDKFPAFTVFYLAPSNVDSPAGCAGTAPPLTACNTVKTKVDLIYAEGTNDVPTGLPNSTQTSGVQQLVALGTTNPNFVKSALPRGVPATIFTGSGVPKAGLAGEFKEFTESATLPAIVNTYRYGQASIKVGEDNSGDGQCTNLGNFKTCPLYETSIVDPSTLTTIQFLTAPLQFLYRIDATKLKRPLSQILSNTLIYYSATGGSFGSPIGVCTTNGATNGDGAPCIDMRPGFEPKCFKNLQSAGGVADLVGDCQWYLLKDSNGFVKFN